MAEEKNSAGVAEVKADDDDNNSGSDNGGVFDSEASLSASGGEAMIFDGKPVLTQRYSIVADASTESLSVHHQQQRHQKHKAKKYKKKGGCVENFYLYICLFDCVTYQSTTCLTDADHSKDEGSVEGSVAAPSNARAVSEEHEPHWLASQCAKVGLPGFGHVEVVFPPQTIAGETAISFDLPALSDPHPYVHSFVCSFARGLVFVRLIE